MTTSSGGRDTQLEALNDLAATISQSPVLEQALERTLDRLLAVTGTDMGSVFTVDPDGGRLRLAASRGVSANFIAEEHCIPMGGCLCGIAAETGRVITTIDLPGESRLTREACRKEQLGAVVCVPLKSADRVVGLLTLYARTPERLALDRDVLGFVSHQIGLAIDNARVFARGREIAASEERGLIAREIHDGVAQNLAYLNLEARRLEEHLDALGDAEALAQLREIRQVLQESYADLRELMVDFRTRPRDGEDFGEILQRYVVGFSQRTGIRIDLQPGAAPPLAPAAQLQLFRIMQEALANVRKHAAAQRVSITVATTTRIEVAIQDDGRGFDPAEVLSGAHLGLGIMRERAERLGGRIAIESRPGGGTTVRVTIPLGADQEQ
jgi:two-component system nitrate/nitrite sensor histidine kinase NarX